MLALRRQRQVDFCDSGLQSGLQSKFQGYIKKHSLEKPKPNKTSDNKTYSLFNWYVGKA